MLLLSLSSSVAAQSVLERSAEHDCVAQVLSAARFTQDAQREAELGRGLGQAPDDRSLAQSVQDSSVHHDSPTNPDAQTVLRGKVEHSSSMQAVDERWKVGKKFSLDNLPVMGSRAITWWRIPNWLAGTWQTYGKIKRLSIKDLEQQKTTEGFNTLDIKYPDSEVIGYQQDSDGIIWTCVPTPYVGRTEQDNHINVSIIYEAIPVSVGEEDVLIKFLATTLTVDKASGKILSVIQRESLQTYRQIEPGKILVRASMKFFNEDGVATHESVVLSQSTRTEAFGETAYLPVPAAVPTLIDMRKSFDNFLRAKQMETLIPERAPLPRVRNYKIITL